MPGSKSITARALIAASLCDGPVVLENPLVSEDTLHLSDALTAFGIEIQRRESSWNVLGGAAGLHAPSDPIHLGGSGTAMRFLTAYAGLVPGETRLQGDARLLERPVGDLLDALRPLGISAESLSGDGLPPVRVLPGSFAGGRTRVRGGISSQYLSALLLIAPYAKQPVTVEVVPPLSSKPYVDITMGVMEAFGVRVQEIEPLVYRVPRGTYHRASYDIEPDASSASYALGAAAVTGASVRVPGLTSSSLQGDARFAELLERMGCAVRRDGRGIEVQGPVRNGIDVDMNAMPDMVPTLAVVAATLEAPTTIRNVGHARAKESDRLATVAAELRKVGAVVHELEDGLVVRGADLHGAEIETYNDHRIAMSFAVLGLKVPGMVVRDPGCVAKSFPGFWDFLDSLG